MSGKGTAPFEGLPFIADGNQGGQGANEAGPSFRTKEIVNRDGFTYSLKNANHRQ